MTAIWQLAVIIFCLAYKYFLNSFKYFLPLKYVTFTLDFVPSSDQVGTDLELFVDNSIGNNILALFLQKSQPAPRNPHSRDTGRRFSGDMVKSSHFFLGGGGTLDTKSLT